MLPIATLDRSADDEEPVEVLARGDRRIARLIGELEYRGVS